MAKKVKEPKPEEIIYHHAVLYTDGSFIANELGSREGFYGSGCHGYIYSDKTVNKPTSDRPNKFRITNFGYVPEDVKGLEGVVNVLPLYFVDGCYSYLNQGTNNVAEIRAVLDGVCDLLKIEGINLASIILKLDSQYVIHIIETIINSKYRKDLWLKPDLPNRDLWEELNELLIICKDNNVHVVCDKVKGHDNEIGNETADRLAYYARLQSCHREINKRFFITNTKNEKYWVANDVRSPLLRFKQLFFTNTIRAKGDEIIYSILDYPTDVSPGTKSSNSCFGLVLLKEVNNVIEDVIKSYHKLGWYTKRFNIISTCDLNNLFTRNNLHWYKMFGNGVYKFDYKQHKLRNIHNVPLIDTIRPAGLAIQALDYMKKLYKLVNDYKVYKENGNDPFKMFLDITDIFYTIEVNDKGVVTYSSKISPTTDIVKIPVDIGKKKINIPLELGKDIVNKNHIKQLEKYKPKITLILDKKDKFINYYTVVDCENGDLGVYCNLYSGRVIL